MFPLQVRLRNRCGNAEEVPHLMRTLPQKYAYSTEIGGYRRCFASRWSRSEESARTSVLRTANLRTEDYLWGRPCLFEQAPVRRQTRAIRGGAQPLPVQRAPLPDRNAEAARPSEGRAASHGELSGPLSSHENRIGRNGQGVWDRTS